MRKKLGLFISIILFSLAFGLYLIFFRFVILEVIYRLIFEGFDGLRKYLFRVALSVDQTANATYPVTWTLLFLRWRNINDDWHRFGNEDETISMALHINKEKYNLNIVGLLLWNLLEFLDPGHGEDAVEKMCE